MEQMWKSLGCGVPNLQPTLTELPLLIVLPGLRHVEMLEAGLGPESSGRGRGGLTFM